MAVQVKLCCSFIRSAPSSASASGVIRWLVLPGLHECAGEWGWNRGAGKRAGGRGKGSEDYFNYSRLIMSLSDENCGVADRRFWWVHLGALEPTGRQQKEVRLHVKTFILPLWLVWKTVLIIIHVKSVYRELVHMVKHICETLKAKRLDCILIIPPAVTR